MRFPLVCLRSADGRGGVEGCGGATQGSSGGERAGDGQEGAVSARGGVP